MKKWVQIIDIKPAAYERVQRDIFRLLQECGAHCYISYGETYTLRIPSPELVVSTERQLSVSCLSRAYDGIGCCVLSLYHNEYAQMLIE